jgi:hypothetical protein
MIPSIWTCGRPNSDKGGRRYGSRNPCCAVSSKSDILFSEVVLGILSSFLRKSINTKVGDKFVAHIWTLNLHYVESGRGRYGYGKEGLRIRKIWTRLILHCLALLGEAMVEFRSPCLDSMKAIVLSTFDGDINHVFSLL